MRYCVVILFMVLFNSSIIAQDDKNIGLKVDNLTFDWDREAKYLATYTGLESFCHNTEYRTEIVHLLEEIHHIDSVLYERAKIAQKRSSNNEIDKLIKDIEKFEKGFSMKEFLVHLHDECVTQKEIEKNKEYTKNEMGAESYDGQVMLLETELNTFIKHITKRVDSIRKHVHHLHIN